MGQFVNEARVDSRPTFNARVRPDMFFSAAQDFARLSPLEDGC